MIGDDIYNVHVSHFILVFLVAFKVNKNKQTECEKLKC